MIGSRGSCQVWRCLSIGFIQRWGSPVSATATSFFSRRKKTQSSTKTRPDIRRPQQPGGCTATTRLHLARYCARPLDSGSSSSSTPARARRRRPPSRKSLPKTGIFVGQSSWPTRNPFRLVKVERTPIASTQRPLPARSTAHPLYPCRSTELWPAARRSTWPRCGPGVRVGCSSYPEPAIADTCIPPRRQPRAP